MTKKPAHTSSKTSSRNNTRNAAAGHLRDEETSIVGLPAFNNRCFGCSPLNQHGLHLKFSEDPTHCRVECTFRLPRRFEGPPNHAHGGIVATILDEAMGKVNRQKRIVALTRRMTVDFLLPVPLGTTLRAIGWAVSQDGRKHFHAGEIRSMDDIVLARSEGLFIVIDPVAMFRKHRRIAIP